MSEIPPLNAFQAWVDSAEGKPPSKGSVEYALLYAAFMAGAGWASSQMAGDGESQIPPAG